MEQKGICKNVTVCSLAKEKVVQTVDGLPGLARCAECSSFLKEFDPQRLESPDKKSGRLGIFSVKTICIIAVIILLSGGVYAYFHYGHPPVFSISIIQKEVNLLEGETKMLNVKVIPFSADKTMIWTSSNDSIAMVDATGVVSGVKPGSVVITAVAAGNERKSASCTVIIEENKEKTATGRPVTSLSMKHDSLMLKTGEWLDIDVNIEPEEASNAYLNWQPEDESIVMVSNGTVVALKEGQTIIIVTTTDGSNLSDTCKIAVVKGTPGDNRITLTFDYGMYIGKMKNNKPDGKGKMIYKKRTLISEDDRQQRHAEAGQTVEGIWYDGRLDTGELLDKDGSKISSLNIGRRP